MIEKDDGSLEVEDQDLKDDTDENEIDTSSVVDEKIKKDLQTTIAKKKAWRAKAVDSESGKTFKSLYEESIKKQTIDTEDKKEEKDKKKETPDISEDLRRDVNSLKEESQKRIFQYANKFSPEQVNEIFAYANGAGIEPKDALEKPFVKKVLEQMKTDEDNANALLSPSHRTPVHMGGKTFKDMTPDERKKAFHSIAKKSR